jgi:hypothetical protein
MFGWTLLWVLLFLVWTGSCLWWGWQARGNYDFQRFLANLGHKDPPSGGSRVKAKR